MDMSKTPDRVTPSFPNSSPKTQRVIVLPSGREIPEALAFTFRDQVLRQAPQLPRDLIYKLKKICVGVDALFSRRRERSMTIVCTEDAGDE